MDRWKNVLEIKNRVKITSNTKNRKNRPGEKKKRLERNYQDTADTAHTKICYWLKIYIRMKSSRQNLDM